MQDNNYYIYELIDPRSGLVFYVGKGKKRDKLGRVYRRIKDHLSLQDRSNKFKASIIKKVQGLGLKIRFNIIKDNITEQEAFLTEVELIKKYGKRIDGTGILVNLTDGGEGTSGKIVSKITKNILSFKAKERYKKYGSLTKGYKHSQETRQLMSEIQKELVKTRPNPMKGKHHTEETKKKLSEKQKGHSNMPKELWYKFSNPGCKNPQARKYLFINPNGEIFRVDGNFKGFVKEMQLSYDTCLEFRDKGKIPEPKNIKHNRMSSERLNSIGWEVKRND